LIADGPAHSAGARVPRRGAKRVTIARLDDLRALVPVAVIQATSRAAIVGAIDRQLTFPVDRAMPARRCGRTASGKDLDRLDSLGAIGSRRGLTSRSPRIDRYGNLRPTETRTRKIAGLEIHPHYRPWQKPCRSIDETLRSKSSRLLADLKSAG
jgi:hypothetical protein